VGRRSGLAEEGIVKRLLVFALVAACSGSGGTSGARSTYNEGVEAMANGDLETAATRFLEARDAAGVDQELRIDAAYNLALTNARMADEYAVPEPEKSMELLRQAAGWFQDAVRLNPEDADARANLEIVLRQIQLLADQLNEGDGLEAKLDRVIEDQRVLRDQLRGLMTRITEAGDQAEPLRFEADFFALEELERTLFAEAGVVGDLAGDELSLIEGKPEEERSDEEKVRLVQLTMLDRYLQDGRTAMSDSRRTLRRLEGDRAHVFSDAALDSLKRAREQLLDPVAVLKLIAQDELMVHRHTLALAELGSGASLLDGGDAVSAPPWLTELHLAARQEDALVRANEILQRFSAAAGYDGSFDSAQDERTKVKQQRMLVAAAEAAPLLTTATDAMRKSATELRTNGSLEIAGDDQRRALEALAAAIERFAEIRQLIEIAYADQSVAVAVLSPDTPKEQLGELTADELDEKVDGAVAKNRERMARLVGMFADEVASIDAQIQQAAQQAGGQLPPDQEQQIAAAKQQYEQAEVFRAQADVALATLEAALADPKSKVVLVEPAIEALAAIEELRRIFYSVIEHLKELRQNQANTHDGTATAHGLEDAERIEALGPLADFQNEHSDMGAAISEALAGQADAATQSGQEGAEEQAERLARAADEVVQAVTSMRQAGGVMVKARDESATMSYDLEPVLTDQQTALEHLDEAIRILEPPQEQEQDEQEQQEQQDQSQQQAQRKLQSVRDREAERERERKRQQRNQAQPVEKDW
jgi:hypothetical protein